MSRFGNILEEVRRKPYDLLDASKTIFERDFLEFNVHISDLEASVQAQISPSSILGVLRHEQCSYFHPPCYKTSACMCWLLQV